MEQEGSKAAFGPVRTLDQLAIQHDLMEEALRQVLGVFVVAALTPQIAVNRFPVPLKQ
jgi:hypothetical protein